MDTPATVTQTGWSDSTFLIGFELDGQMFGYSGLVSFPPNQSGKHLDVNGLINGIGIYRLTMVTGHHNQIQVWGSEDAVNPKIYGLKTSDMGQHWSTVFNNTSGNAPMPVAATDDGNTVIYESSDGKNYNKSDDGGDTQSQQPAFGNGVQGNQSIFLTPDGKHFAAERNDGTYLIQNGQWNKVTSVAIAYLTNGASSHVRLWSVNSQGQLTWQDD